MFKVVKRDGEIADFNLNKIKDAIEKIRGGVNDISEMVLTSSAASQENAAASEELATQAQLLKELIENFKVDE